MPHIVLRELKSTADALSNFIDKLADGVEELETNGPNPTLESAIESGAAAYVASAAAAFGSAGEEIQNAM